MLIKVCVNGVRALTDHPRLSADAKEVAAEVQAAVAVGAGAVHVHPKNAAGLDSLDADDVARWLRTTRESCPGVPVGVTTGAWCEPDPRARVQAVRSWTVVPDFASVNWHEDRADDVVAALVERGIGVEAGIWHDEGLARWRDSPSRSGCVRVLVELAAADGCDAVGWVQRSAAPLVAAIREVEPELPILLHGEDSSAWAAIDVAAGLGLDTRVGLEDTVRLPNGAVAGGNAELVAATASRIAAFRQPELRRTRGDRRADGFGCPVR